MIHQSFLNDINIPTDWLKPMVAIQLTFFPGKILVFDEIVDVIMHYVQLWG